MIDLRGNTLGLSEIPVSKLGLGMAALGRPGYINLGHGRDLSGKYAPADLQAHAHAMLDAAWEAGLRYFDVARSYGRGEEFLGNWLRSRQPDRDEIGIGSKWGYTYTANWQVRAEKHEIKEHSLPVLQRQWQESQEHLGNYLRLYQIHSATLDSGVLDNQAVLKELARLRDSGYYIGLSLSGANQSEVLKKALDTSISGNPLFSTVQATWNLLEPSATDALRLAHASGMGVIVKEVLANGRLTTRNTNPAFAAKRERLAREADTLECSIEALALAAVLKQPFADVVLTGAATIEQLRDNLDAFSIPAEMIDPQLFEDLAETPDEYWERRSDLAWN